MEATEVADAPELIVQTEKQDWENKKMSGGEVKLPKEWLMQARLGNGFK